MNRHMEAHCDQCGSPLMLGSDGKCVRCEKIRSFIKDVVLPAPISPFQAPQRVKELESGLFQLRESVRRLLIPVLKRCADHPMRCDYSDDANIALTTFLAENKEMNEL